MNRQQRRQLARQRERAQRHPDDTGTVPGAGARAVASRSDEAGQARQSPQAEANYQEAPLRRPDRPDAPDLLGLAALRVDRQHQRAQSLAQAVAPSSGEPASLNNQALALRAQGKLDEAAATLRRAIALKPGYAEAHSNLGVVLGEQGQLEEAVACYRRALALKPHHAEAHNNLGVALRASGLLDEAIACYRRAVALKPDYPEAYSNLGVTLDERGERDEAVASLRRAVALRPDYTEAHNNLGVALRARGELDEAAACYRRAVALKPDYADAFQNLGVVLGEQGKTDEAAACYRRVIALRPDHAEAHNNLGVALREQGQLDEAAANLRRAVALKPDYPDAFHNLGVVLGEQGKPDEAATCYQQVIALKPDHLLAYSNLGVLLEGQGKADEAVEALRRAIALNPDHAESHSNLGVALRAQGKPDEAAACYRRAVALKPDYPEAHNNLGVALREQGQPAEAEASLLRAIALKPDYAEAHSNLSVLLVEHGRMEEAVESVRRAIELRPEYAEARFGAALLQLLQGDLERGFAGYEWRWRSTQGAAGVREFAQPAWDGGPLEGRTILLHAEQGLGDTLQFARYAPLVAARGGRVVLECQRELVPLLRSLAGVARVVARGEELPAFDVYAPLLGLPHLLGTTLETIPVEVPYLRADPARVEAWAEYLDGADGGSEAGLRVGLVWAGNPANTNDRRRSLPLEALAPLGQVPGVHFFALQKGPGAEQADTPPAGLAVTNLGPLFADFADTAAVLEQLDLIITVDTSVAHLAGALGRPVWVMLPLGPDWRWLLEREDSPWYPTARLFRQQRFGDWAGVVAGVAASLGDLATADPERAVRRRPAPRPPVADGQAATAATYLAVPLGGAHGWGICGKYLARELAGLGDIRLLTDQFDLDTIGDELEYRFLERLVYHGPPVSAEAPVLQCITGKDLLPYRPTLRGRFSAGYTFFEENLLPPAAIESARRHFDLVVAGSTWCQEVLEAHGLRDVRTVIQGIDPTIFFPTGAEKEYFRDRFVVFSGGKFELRKGQDLVIRAYKVLQDRHPDVMLVNAWSNAWDFSFNTMRVSPHIRFEPTATDHVERIGQILADNGVDLSRVVTLRPRPNVTMGRIYRNTDVGLFPNRCEGGTNLVLMEYMACGRPVVAAYNSGHRDVVDDDNAVLIRTMWSADIVENGHQVATWDEPDLEETVERLEWAYQNRERLREIGERAGQDLAKLTWRRTAEQFSEILSGGVRSPRPSDMLPAAPSPDVAGRAIVRVDDPVGRAEPTNGATEPEPLARPDGADESAPAVRLVALAEQTVVPNGATEPQPGGTESAGEQLPADAALLASLQRSPEYEAIRARLVDQRPADSWQDDELRFFAFELLPDDGAGTTSSEPSTAVFAVRPASEELISAVVVTLGPDGGEPEIVDLHETRRVAATPVA